MGLLHGLWLLVVGALGAATIVARDRRGARVLTELEPYRGWIGVISAVIGAWRLFWVLLELPAFRWFNHWLLRAVDGALLLSLGLVLGVGILRGLAEGSTGPVDARRVDPEAPAVPREAGGDRDGARRLPRAPCPALTRDEAGLGPG